MITQDVIATGDELLAEVHLKIATARVVLIQGLGDQPLRLCLSARNDPFKMWARLRDKHTVCNTATRVQLQTPLARMVYFGQMMQDFIEAFEHIFNRLSSMGSQVPAQLQVAMFLVSFTDKNTSKFGHSMASLQSKHDNLDSETATARLLQE